jgi:hypothetical protein
MSTNRDISPVPNVGLGLAIVCALNYAPLSALASSVYLGNQTIEGAFYLVSQVLYQSQTQLIFLTLSRPLHNPLNRPPQQLSYNNSPVRSATQPTKPTKPNLRFAQQHTKQTDYMCVMYVCTQLCLPAP